MKYLYTLILVLSAIISGCGGDSAPEILQTSETPVNVVGIGDSTISVIYYDTNKLRVNLPVGSAFTTYGAPGQCAIEGQQNNLNIIANTPKNSVIIFLSGINDARRCGTSVEQFKLLVIDLHNAAYANGSKFVVITPNPTYTGAENELLTQYANAERSLGYNLADLRDWIENPNIPKPFDYGVQVASDGTHMTPIIYDWLSPKLASVIKLAK